MARVPYVGEQELPPEAQELIQSHAVRPGEPMYVRQAIANNQSLLVAHHEYSARIRSETGLSTRERELSILSIASRMRSAYIW